MISQKSGFNMVEKMDDCERAIRKNVKKKDNFKKLKRTEEKHRNFNLDNPLSSKSNTKVPQTQNRSENKYTFWSQHKIKMADV